MQKKGGNVKTIPPYRPVTVENSDVSSPEKEPSDNWTKTSGKRKPSTNSSKNNPATPSSKLYSLVCNGSFNVIILIFISFELSEV